MMDKFILLGLSRYFFIDTILDSAIAQSNKRETQEFENEAHQWISAFVAISSILGLKLKPDMVYKIKSEKKKKYTHWMEYMMFEVFENDTLAQQIEERHSYRERLAFECIQWFGAANQIGMASYNIESYYKTDQVVTGFEVLWKKQARIIGQKLADNEHAMFQLLDEELKGTYEHLMLSLFDFAESQQALDWEQLIEIRKVSETMMFSIITDYRRIMEDFDRASKLMDELRQIKPGRDHWKRYEDTIEKIIRFLFSSYFPIILTQNRTEDNYQIRDIIIPNTSELTFWKNVRTEFMSKNIVIEIKNEVELKASAVDQLKRYLDKKSIGKFGMIMYRENKHSTVDKAIKSCYLDNDTLILTVNDKSLDTLVRARAIIGDCSDLLLLARTDFELSL